MRLEGTYEIMPMNDEVMVIPVGDETMSLHGVIRLNASGAEIFEMLKEDISVESIVLKLSEKYDNEAEELAIYVNKVVKVLTDKGMLCLK